VFIAEVLLAASLPVGACGAYNIYGAATGSVHDSYFLPLVLIIAIPSLLFGLLAFWVAMRMMRKP
jgi:hypothetical protein